MMSATDSVTPMEPVQGTPSSVGPCGGGVGTGPSVGLLSAEQAASDSASAATQRAPTILRYSMPLSDFTALPGGRSSASGVPCRPARYLIYFAVMPLRILELHAAKKSETLNDEWLVLENTGTSDFVSQGCKLVVARNPNARG